MTGKIDVLAPVPPPSTETIERFVNSLTLLGDEGRLSLQSAFPAKFSIPEKLQLLQAGARTLQHKFEQSEFSFFDVTTISTRIQALLRELNSLVRQTPQRVDRPTVLVTSPFSEQHTLMQNLVDLHFRLCGWETIHHPQIRAETLTSMLASRSIDIVCTSWSNSRVIEEFGDMIAIIAALNASKRPPIIAGGFAAERAASQIAEWGVDCICDNVYSALDIAERYISLRHCAKGSNSANAAIKDALSFSSLR